MIYRVWTREDLAAIAALEKECFSDPWTLRMFSDSFVSAFAFGVIAEENGELTGFAIESVLFEDAEIADVAVKESFRRRGIANELLNRLEEEAMRRGAERSLLEVRASNAAAMSVYLRRGYVGVRERRGYYSDGEDALVMQKSLL